MGSGLRRRRLDRRLFAVLRLLAARAERPGHRVAAELRQVGRARRRFRPGARRVVVTLDGDLQDVPAEIPCLLAQLDEGFDLVSAGRPPGTRSRGSPRPSSTASPSAVSGAPPARLELRVQGLPRRGRPRCRSTASCTASFRCSPTSAASRWGRSPSSTARPSTAGRTTGSSRFMRGFFDLLTVFFLGRYRRRPLHLFGVIGLALASVSRSST